MLNNRRPIKTRSVWSIVAQKNGAVWIVDADNGAMSVTNDAENVIAALHHDHALGAQRVFYRDSESRWDELLHDGNGKFNGFAFGTDGFESPRG